MPAARHQVDERSVSGRRRLRARVAPQSRVRTAALYRLLELAQRCGVRELEFNQSALARAVGCSVRHVQRIRAYLCARGILEPIDIGGGRGRGLRVRVNLDALRFRLAAERRNYDIPLAPSRKKKRSKSSEHVVCHEPLRAELRRRLVRRAAVALRASPARPKRPLQIPLAASGMTGSEIASQRLESVTGRAPVKIGDAWFALATRVLRVRDAEVVASPAPRNVSLARSGQLEESEGQVRARTPGPYFVAGHGSSRRGCVDAISEPPIVQDQLRGAIAMNGAARSFTASARVSRPAPGRECTHGRCGAWCRYIRIDDTNRRTGKTGRCV